MNNSNEEKTITDLSFCRLCAERSFKIWKGWITRDARDWVGNRRKLAYLPELPILTEGKKCPMCDGSSIVSAKNIYYKNYHNEYSTGLPDYFYLIIDERSPDKIDHKLSKWEFPYLEKPLGYIPFEKLIDHVKEFCPNSD